MISEGISLTMSMGGRRVSRGSSFPTECVDIEYVDSCVQQTLWNRGWSVLRILSLPNGLRQWQILGHPLWLSRIRTRISVTMFGKRLRRVAINVIGKSGSLLFFPPLLQASSCFIAALIQLDTCSTNIYMCTDTHIDINIINKICV